MNPTSKAFEDAKRSILSNVTSSEDRLSVMKIPIEGETKEVTATGGSSGPYTPKLSLFSDEETKKQSKGGEVSEDEKLKKEKGEFKEATSSASSGSYVGASFLAKSQNKKDWRGAAKPQYKGGKFVRVKRKCKTFPYCNQGDIKALELWEDDKLTEAIKNVAKNKNIHENVVRAIVLHEIEQKLFGE